MRNFVRTGIVCAIILALIATSFASVSMKEPMDTSSEDLAKDLDLSDQELFERSSRISGDFTENRGQIENTGVKYYIEGQGVWLVDDGVVFDFKKTEETLELSEPENIDKELPHELEEKLDCQGVAFKLTFEGANQVSPAGTDLQLHTSNFLYNDNPNGFLFDVPHFNEVIYTNIYDNIDLIYRNTESGLKYDFIVHPGGDPNDIRLSYEGANDLCLDTAGDLIINTDVGAIKDTRPYIYQETLAGKDQIQGSFEILDLLSYGFDISGMYDITKDLIIDPMIYSTFVGGSSHETGMDIEVDSDRNAYVTGFTLSDNFPTTLGAYDTVLNGNYDVFVFKLNNAGSALIYSTYVGGKHHDLGYGIELNNENEAFVTGFTHSEDFPTTAGAFDTSYNGNFDVFVFRLKSDGGALVYSTFVGGQGNDLGMDLDLDEEDNAYVTGYTESNNFPTVAGSYDTSLNGNYDVFVFELKWTGANLIYSTFVGGKHNDAGFGITLDADNNAYVTGGTLSTNFPVMATAYDPTHNGGYDVFVFKLKFDGTGLDWSTFVGHNNHEWGLDLVLDSENNAYVTGFTLSPNFPVTVGAYDTSHNGGYDVFVFKLKNTGTNLDWSTFVGGSSHEWGYAIDIDPYNDVYVTGFTYSSDFPVTASAFDTTFNGMSDVFVFKLRSNGATLLYSTFVGGYRHDWGVGIVIDSVNAPYVTGLTQSLNFPTTAAAFDTTHNGGVDAFVFKLGMSAVSPATIGPMKHYWVLGQFPRHTWIDLTTFSSTGANVHFWGTNTMGTLKSYLGSVNIPAPEGKYQPKKISRNVGEYFSDSTSDTKWLTCEWYYLEMASDQPFMVVLSRSVILEGSHVTHSDQILSKPPTKHNTDWWFTNGGSIARDDKVLMYSDEPNLLLKFKDRVIADHYPIMGGAPGDNQLAGFSSTTFTGLHLVDAKDIMDNNAGLYSFHSHACYDYAIGVFDQYFHSDDGDKLPSAPNSTSEYKSRYYHGWYGLDRQKSRYMEVKDTRIYAEQPAEELWGIYTPDNKLQYTDINGATQTTVYAAHPDEIHRDTVWKKDMPLYPAGAPPYYVEVQNVPGGMPFASDLPSEDEVIAHRATYFGYDPVVAKLLIANPYDCDVVIAVVNWQNLKRAIFTVPAHDVVAKDLYYDPDFDNFFDPVVTTAVYRPGMPDHAFIIEVGAFILTNISKNDTGKSPTHEEIGTSTTNTPKTIKVDVFQKVTDTLMLRQYNRILEGTYDGTPCPKPDEPDECTVDTPTIKPPGGSYDGEVNVTITTTTAGATIYYTTDGTEPTQASTKYEGPFYLTYNAPVLLRARAYKDPCKPSGIANANYTLTQKVTTPSIVPPGGNYYLGGNVSIYCNTSGAVIYYTLDGNEPTVGSNLYTGPFYLSDTATVKAKAFKTGWTPSDTASAYFYIFDKRDAA